MSKLDDDTLKQLAISRNNELLQLHNLKIAREIKQDDIEYLVSTIHPTVNLEYYCRAIETVLRHNKRHDLL